MPREEQKRRGEEWTSAHTADLDGWSAACKAIKDGYGVELDDHGSASWRVPIVKIAEAGHTARRGYPQVLAPDALAVDPEWDEKLQRFVTDLGIDTSEAKGPGWFLASWWG